MIAARNPHPYPHPLLQAAKKANESSKKALQRLGDELEERPPGFLSTVAINLWSPYLPYGRDTSLLFPKSQQGRSLFPGRSEGQFKLTFDRYMRLLGRNVSANHLIIEVDDVQTLIIDATRNELLGPRIENNDGRKHVVFELPLSTDADNTCFSKLVPPDRLAEWINWLKDDSGAYERLYESILREELSDCRRDAMRELPKCTDPFLDHLKDWIINGLVPYSVGLGDFDDRWLCRIQMTAIASAIWGPIWVTHKLSLDGDAENELNLTASCTVTGKGLEDREETDSPLQEQIHEFANLCSELLTKYLEEELKTNDVSTLLGLAEKSLMGSEIQRVEKGFSGILGESLIGEDHESKPLRLRGILTPGLDSLKMTAPTRIKILYEIQSSQFKLQTNSNDYWGVWKALFKSNDLLLSKEGVALHFELELSHDGTSVLPAPRHVVQLSKPIDIFLQNIGTPPRGLLQQGFESSKRMAHHFRKMHMLSGETIIEKQIQRKGESIQWGDRSSDARGIDWGVISAGLREALSFIPKLQPDPFFREIALTLSGLSNGQIAQVADGVAEVGRQGYGCLVFIGQVCRKRRDESYWFYGNPGIPGLSKYLEITRLGLSLQTVSQVPDAHSFEFRNHFADMAGMDGETIISAWPSDNVQLPNGYQAYLPAGNLIGGRFVQLPKGTPPLLDPLEPRLSDNYDASWEQIKSSISTDYLESVEREGLSCRFLAHRERENDRSIPLNKSDLLSLGTRHRKAAMTTMCMPSVVAITCSASGNIKVWLHGVPVIDIKPDKDILLPYLSPPTV
jgi:hypothetical protein